MAGKGAAQILLAPSIFFVLNLNKFEQSYSEKLTN